MHPFDVLSRLRHVSASVEAHVQQDLRDLIYPHTIGAMSLLSFMNPASKSGASYGSEFLIKVEPRLNGYSVQC